MVPAFQVRSRSDRGSAPAGQPCFTTSIAATLIVLVPSSSVPVTFTGTPIWPSATVYLSSVYSFSSAKSWTLAPFFTHSTAHDLPLALAFAAPQ